MAEENPKVTLELLARLQKYMSRKDYLKAEIEATPGRIAALEEDTEKQKSAVQQAESTLQEENLKNTRLDGELKSLQENLSGKQVQTLEVKTNEQLWAIQKEIKYIEEKISENEMEIIQTMEDIDTREEELTEAKQRFDSQSSENKKKISEMQKELETMQKELEDVTIVLDEVSAEIPQEHARLLNRIQTAKSDGIAMAEAKDETCLACNFRIRPQIYVEIKLGQGIYQCNNCSRILYYKGETA